MKSTYDNDELFDIERTLVETIARSMDALNVDGTRKNISEYFDSTLLPEVIEEMESLVQAGCEIIRITVPNHKSVEALYKIRKFMFNRGINIPLVADIHFNPQLAVNAAEFVEKVRINPIIQSLFPARVPLLRHIPIDDIAKLKIINGTTKRKNP